MEKERLAKLERSVWLPVAVDTIKLGDYFKRELNGEVCEGTIVRVWHGIFDFFGTRHTSLEEARVLKLWAVGSSIDSQGMWWKKKPKRRLNIW